MLSALIAGDRAQEGWPSGRKAGCVGQRRQLVEAFTGRLSDHHAFLLATMLTRIDQAAPTSRGGAKIETARPISGGGRPAG